MLCMRVAAPVLFFMRPQRIKKKQNTTLVYKVLYFVCYAIYIGGGSEYFRSEIKFFQFSFYNCTSKYTRSLSSCSMPRYCLVMR